ncbi:MAG: serine protease [Candidatus Saccharibacteria bacterium]|nr:serine protease [Candidatus Saccharibacteria bacterium]
MNDTLQLKGTFQHKPHGGKPGSPNVPNGQSVSVDHLHKLLGELKSLRSYWVDEKLLSGALIDVCYKDVVAKSRRVSCYFAIGNTTSNSTVVGARFTDGVEKKHIITHYVGMAVLDSTIERIERSIKLLESVFGGALSHAQMGSMKAKEDYFDEFGSNKSTFLGILVDSHYIEGFKIPQNEENLEHQSIVTVYRTDEDVIKVMRKIGIDIYASRLIGETTLLLRPDEIVLLKERAPYLIAMATEDISKLSKDDFKASESDEAFSIPDPVNEPVIGVIDTMFDDRVYFSKWVKFENKVDEAIELVPEDFVHGTAVSSIIVDGPSINPGLDDGCGRFKVRHFGVAVQQQYSTFSIMQAIREVVNANKDIKVWNLSLGSDREINENSISPEAAILDKLQFENDIVFVVAGTNNKDLTRERIIGSPADSINSVVVNSVNSQDQPASYARKGIVLSFFNKPDVSSYGGDSLNNDYVRVCTPTGEGLFTGTSFAAPWITRKLAYLIHMLGLTREVAKALIVDSAAGWNDTGNDPILAPLVGHGVVPIRIEDIIQSKSDEIRFVIRSNSEMYDTYTYNLPIPTQNSKHPFVAKATMCYFPNCSISQGVDYTNTELDVYIGRVNDGVFKPINKNVQSVDDGEAHYVREGSARKLYRKWDNTKHIRESYGDQPIARKAYENGMWGISVKTKERLGARDGEGIEFGLVVTLKEINGQNRIDDFIRQCELRGWLVSKLDIDNSVEIYAKSQEFVSLDS